MEQRGKPEFVHEQPTYNNLLQGLTELCYGINLKDAASGEVGTFAYTEAAAKMGYGFWSISPVFADVDKFYAWAKEQGFPYHSLEHTCVLVREFPCKRG